MNKIAAFYNFIRVDEPEELKKHLAALMAEYSVVGTFILAKEGYNATVAAVPDDLDAFIREICLVLPGEFKMKTSFHEGTVFKRAKVKIKNEIVTLRTDVEIDKGDGTHVTPSEWDKLLSDPDVLLIDTRNNYEYEIGTFRGAINPKIEKFSDLPDYIETHFSPEETPKIATFCTGGIRCEKLVPLLKEKGYQDVYQLDGGILGFFEETGNESGIWKGDCFVFDERVSVKDDLTQGESEDFSALKSLSQPEQDEGQS